MQRISINIIIKIEKHNHQTKLSYLSALNESYSNVQNQIGNFYGYPSLWGTFMFHSAPLNQAFTEVDMHINIYVKNHNETAIHPKPSDSWLNNTQFLNWIKKQRKHQTPQHEVITIIDTLTPYEKVKQPSYKELPTCDNAKIANEIYLAREKMKRKTESDKTEISELHENTPPVRWQPTHSLAFLRGTLTNIQIKKCPSKE